MQMDRRTRDFFGEVPVKEPVIRSTAPQPGLPNVADAPAGFSERFTGGSVDGDAAAAEVGQP